MKTLLKTLLLTVAVAPFCLSGATGRSPSDAPMPADKVIAKACDQAKTSKKDVLVLFHASWCGWCKKLDEVFSDPKVKAVINRAYVVTYLDVLENGDKKSLENPGGEKMLEQWDGKDQGIPYYVVLSSNGRRLADSRYKGTDGKLTNMGCPAEPQEIDAFMTLLKRSTKLKSDEEKALRARFGKVKGG